VNRLRVIVGESLRSLTANLSTTVAATTTVLIGMFLLGLVIVLTGTVNSLSDRAKRQLVVKVYFCTASTCGTEATARQINATRSRLLGMPEVESVKFVSKDEALRIMQERAPDLVKGISSNPLPPSFDVKARNADDVPVLGKRLEASLPPAVQDVNWGEKMTKGILYFARVVWVTSLIAMLVLVFASALLIANTIRLSIFARRREIEVMKLVGATNWFIRGPFMLEGLLCGLVGSAAAVLLLLLGKLFVVSAITRDRDWGVQAMSFSVTVLVLLAVGLLLGAAGSGLTLRRFLRV
jgi:cell division transport system permease protein